MRAEEFCERVQRGDIVRVLFDTNAVERHRRFQHLCDRIQRLNSAYAEQRGCIELCISATAHAEKLFHLKQSYGDRYDVAAIMETLRGIGLEILPFAPAHAEATATYLGTRFPDRASWREAKRARCLACLGADLAHAPGSQCSATIDWLIAAHAVAEACVLITDDRGPEFEGVAQKMTLDVLEDAVRELLRQAEAE